MQTVVLTPTFEAHAKAAGVSEEEIADIVDLLAHDPMAGVVMVGTGGARKVRFAARGQGKSGGYRIVHFYAGEDIPIFLLGLVSKRQRVDLSQSERDRLRTLLGGLAEAYRDGAKNRVQVSRRDQ